MLNYILKACIACFILVSVVACEKDIAGDGLLIGDWHFTEWEGPEGRLVEADVPPLDRETGDTVLRVRSVELNIQEQVADDGWCAYKMSGHVNSFEFDGSYRITNRGTWEAAASALTNFRGQPYIDPWMERLFEVLMNAHSYELEGNQLMIYNDDMRVFLQKQ